nr:MAG TPA: hypothetical protein [Caudoviricetes sp.]
MIYRITSKAQVAHAALALYFAVAIHPWPLMTE